MLYVVSSVTYSADWSFSIVHSILYIVCPILYNVPSFWSIFCMFSVVGFTMCWIWYVVHPVMQFVHCTVHVASCILYVTGGMLYIVSCMLNIVHSIMDVVYFTLYVCLLRRPFNYNNIL